MDDSRVGGRRPAAYHPSKGPRNRGQQLFLKQKRRAEKAYRSRRRPEFGRITKRDRLS